jgi:Flp pilus assembly protein TadB
MNTALAVTFVIALGGLGYFITLDTVRIGYGAMCLRWSNVMRKFLQFCRASQKSSPGCSCYADVCESGWPADVFTLVALAESGYLVCAIGLKVAGASDLIAALAAAPTAILIAWLVVKWVAKKRVSTVNKQLIVMLDLMIAQVRGGVGAERALMLVTPALPSPLRGEMTKVMDRATSGSDVLTELQELATRYPSRAFAMFLAALEVDRNEGHRLEPALTQSFAEMLKTFTLRSEARAELSSTKWEFYGVTAVICGISVKCF